MISSIKTRIKTGQSLWFVPTNEIYGPPREIKIYQTGAIWAYFRDKWYEGRVSLNTNELEYQEGKVYQSQENWQGSGESYPNSLEISTKNKTRLERIKLSQPLMERQKTPTWWDLIRFATNGFIMGGIVGLIATQIVLPKNFWQDLNVSNQNRTLVALTCITGSVIFSWGYWQNSRKNEG